VISPEPTRVHSDIKWIPGMSLYHSNQSHYDLLLDNDSRLGNLAKTFNLGPQEPSPRKQPEIKSVTEKPDIVGKLVNLNPIILANNVILCVLHLVS